MKLRFTATALAEVSEILGHVAEQSPAAARRIAMGLDETLERLRRFPFSARATDEPEVRVAPVPGLPYLVFYQPGRGELLIRNVRHGARTWP